MLNHNSSLSLELAPLRNGRKSVNTHFDLNAKSKPNTKDIVRTSRVDSPAKVKVEMLKLRHDWE